MKREPSIESVGNAGFENVRKIAQLDYFSGSESESTKKTASYFGAISITIVGDKP